MSESRIQYGNRPVESFIVYKFIADPNKSEFFVVQWWTTTTIADYIKIIPDNYRPYRSSIIKSKDYYLVVHLKEWEDAVCYYYIRID